MSPNSPWLINAAVIGLEGICISSWFHIQGQVWWWTISTKDHVGFYGLCGYGVYILSHALKAKQKAAPHPPQPPNHLHSSLWESSASFLWHGQLQVTREGYSPERETASKAVESRSASGQQQPAAHVGIVGIVQIMGINGQGQDVSHSPYAAMPDPANPHSVHAFHHFTR